MLEVSGEEGRNGQTTEGFYSDPAMADTCHYALSKPIDWTQPRMNPKVNDGLWAIMMCPCGFIECNDVPLGWGRLTVGEPVRGAGWGPMGILCAFH